MTVCKDNQIRFSFYCKRNLTLNFNGGQISSDGGLVLLRQLDKKLGLTEGLVGCISDSRHQGYTKQSSLDIIRQRIYQIAAGYEDANDADSLRNDPIFKAINNRATSDDPLSSQPTISRFENMRSPQEIYRLTKYLFDFYLSTKGSTPSHIILDIDSTEDPTHGNQQLSFFHGYYDKHIYHPLLIFDGDSGELITAVLRPGNVHASRKVVSILRRIITRLRDVLGETRMIIRADAGFAIPALYRFCESEKLSYIIGLITNHRLTALGSELFQKAEEVYKQTGLKQRLFSDVYYQATSWGRYRRVIIKAEHNHLGSNRRFVVTNMKGNPRELYDFYALRGECENRIKELKNDLKADRLSCHRFRANQFRLLLHAAAYVLMHAFQGYLKGTELENAQMGTICNKLIKIGARVKQSCRRLWINLASGFPFQRIFMLLYQRLTASG
jgi:hypothetical protein